MVAEVHGSIAGEPAIGFEPIYLHLAANGWDTTLTKFKPKIAQAAVRMVTVGDLTREVRANCPKRGRTLDDYIRCFRHIVADIFEIDGGTEKYDYRAGGRQRWVEKVDAIEVARVTPALVQKWKIDFLSRADANPAKKRMARISVNSLLRQARSLFSTKRLQFVQVAGLKSPFEGIALEPRQSMRYRSTLRIHDLCGQAMAELGNPAFNIVSWADPT